MDRSVASLLAAIFLLETGSGLMGILIPVRAEIAGFPSHVIAVLGTLHYVGFVVGCLALPAFIRRTGHVRSFSALAAVATCAVLGFALTGAEVAWMALRVVVGLCFAGMFMVTESWLNDRGTSATRGRLLGRYMATTWVGVILGKLAYGGVGQTGFAAYALVAMAIVLSMVPLTVTSGAVPAIPRPSRLRIGALLRLAPAGLVGCLLTGVANSAFWIFAPLYARHVIGVGAPVSLFMAACVLGGALCQGPLGRLSDRVDRRWIILLASLASAVFAGCLAGAMGTAMGTIAPYVLGFLFGAASLSIYALCVAYANDRASPEDYVDVSSHLLLVFGLGAVVGPLVAAPVVARFGYPGVFLCIVAAELALALHVVAELLGARRVPAEQRSRFAGQPPLTHGTQAVAGLNPEIAPDPAGRSAKHPSAD